jgi:hypothetical protein
MNVGAWLIDLTVLVPVLAGCAALALWSTRGMDPTRDRELERLMARVRDTLGEDAMDGAVSVVTMRAARDGWFIDPDPNIDIDRQPGSHLDPRFQVPFEEEVKKELRRRLKQREASVLLSRYDR